MNTAYLRRLLAAYEGVHDDGVWASIYLELALNPELTPDERREHIELAKLRLSDMTQTLLDQRVQLTAKGVRANDC